MNVASGVDPEADPETDADALLFYTPLSYFSFGPRRPSNPRGGNTRHSVSLGRFPMDTVALCLFSPAALVLSCLGLVANTMLLPVLLPALCSRLGSPAVPLSALLFLQGIAYTLTMRVVLQWLAGQTSLPFLTRHPPEQTAPSSGRQQKSTHSQNKHSASLRWWSQTTQPLEQTHHTPRRRRALMSAHVFAALASFLLLMLFQSDRIADNAYYAWVVSVGAAGLLGTSTAMGMASVRSLLDRPASGLSDTLADSFMSENIPVPISVSVPTAVSPASRYNLNPTDAEVTLDYHAFDAHQIAYGNGHAVQSSIPKSKSAQTIASESASDTMETIEDVRAYETDKSDVSYASWVERVRSGLLRFTLPESAFHLVWILCIMAVGIWSAYVVELSSRDIGRLLLLPLVVLHFLTCVLVLASLEESAGISSVSDMNRFKNQHMYYFSNRFFFFTPSFQAKLSAVHLSTQATPTSLIAYSHFNPHSSPNFIFQHHLSELHPSYSSKATIACALILGFFCSISSGILVYAPTLLHYVLESTLSIGLTTALVFASASLGGLFGRYVSRRSTDYRKCWGMKKHIQGHIALLFLAPLAVLSFRLIDKYAVYDILCPLALSLFAFIPPFLIESCVLPFMEDTVDSKLLDDIRLVFGVVEGFSLSFGSLLVGVISQFWFEYDAAKSPLDDSWDDYEREKNGEELSSSLFVACILSLAPAVVCWFSIYILEGKPVSSSDFGAFLTIA